MQDETTATVTLVAQLRGRASFLLDRGEIKSPGLMNDAARTIEAQSQEIETLRAQLAEAMTLMKDCADDLESEVKDRWGYDDRLSHKLERDLAPVVAVRAFLTKHRAAAMDGLIAGDADLTVIKRG